MQSAILNFYYSNKIFNQDYESVKYVGMIWYKKFCKLW